MNPISSNSAMTPPAVPEPRPAPPVSVAPVVEAASAVQEPVAPVAAEPAEARPEPDRDTVQKISDDLQRKVGVVTPELQFTVDDSSGRSIIKVTDRTTNDLIRQIPSEETLEINKGLDRYQQGLLVNRKA